MKFATFSIDNQAGVSRTDQQSAARIVEAEQGWWVRFGSDLLVYAADNKFDSATGSISALFPKAQQKEGSVKKGNMHLVVQKGRTFQLENPDTRVILDKGRYLVVDMPRATARKLSRRKDPCFHIEPLRENTTVFKTIAREPPSVQPAQPVIDIVSSVQESEFAANLVQLASHPTRFSNSSHFQMAAAWASEQFTAMGMSSSVVPIDVPGLGASANVVARKAGLGTTGRKNILVVAHLDSVNQQGGSAANAPGADDNASGSAGVLTMAAALAAAQFNHDLTFILFGGEEQGLHGSIQYLDGLSSTDKSNTHAVLNMDMIGSVNSTPPSVLLESATASQWMIDGLASSAAAHTSLEVEVSLNPFGSDHMTFLNAGITAVLTIEGADSANGAIHTENDTVDGIDTGFATEILRMNLGFIAAEAGIATTAETQCDCAETGLDAATNENINILAGHYQVLFSQYSRLARDGRLEVDDYNNWHLARQSHDMLAAGANLPKTTDS